MKFISGLMPAMFGYVQLLWRNAKISGVLVVQLIEVLAAGSKILI